MGRRTTTSEIIERSKNTHGDKYDYSLVEYVDYKTKVKIICPEHGIFEQIPNSHIFGSGCPKCYKRNLSQEKYIEKANEKHDNFYDYSLVEYVNSRTKIKIICPEHGIFEQTPNSHLNGNGCPKCYGKFMDTKYFIEKSKEIHGDKYDYSLVDYINSKTKVKIICSEHGIFEQIPYNHLRGSGCPKCSGQGIIYLPFNEVLEFVRNLGLKSQKEWREYCLSGQKPIDIPPFPDRFYKKPK